MCDCLLHPVVKSWPIIICWTQKPANLFDLWKPNFGACQPLWCQFVPPLVNIFLGDITIILVGGTEFAIVELAAKIRSSIFRFLKERLSQLLLFVLIWRMCAFCFMLFESLSLFCHLLVYQYHVFYVVGCFSPYFFHCLARGERR